MSEENISDIRIEKESDEVNKIKNLRDQLKKCEAERSEYLVGWQRAKADFINYKNELAKQMAELKDFALEDFLREFLPILDSFDCAISASATSDVTQVDKKWLEGVLNIKKQMMDYLKTRGLEEINVGEKFDLALCEAIETEKREDIEENRILKVLQKGYKLSGKVIRPAKVKISIK